MHHRTRCPRWTTMLLVALLTGACAVASANDRYEPDDEAARARPIPTDGEAQLREIAPASDVDWVGLKVAAGDRCVIETAPAPDEVRDTVLTLFAPDGRTSLAEDDDGGERLFSRITHTFRAAGTYYARVRSYGASYTGSYHLSVRLSRPSVIRGRVTQAGAPVEGVAVWARPVSSRFDEPAGIVTTDADGSYVLDVEAGTYAVSAHRAGMVPVPAERRVTAPSDAPADFSLSPARAPSGDGVQTCRAVLVGIADYAGTSSDLDYCDDDARAFAARLAEGRNWRAENIAVILNREATRDAIWSALQRMASLSDADDLCVFVFSGHGSRGPDLPPLDEAGGQDEYLVEADGVNDIRDDELGEWIAQLPTAKFLAVIASCYSGGMVGPASEGAKGLGNAEPSSTADGFAEDLRRALARKAGRGGHLSALDLDDNGFGVVLTAADAHETCRESSELGHDIFVHYLLEAMAGAAGADGDGWLSAEELHAWAAPRATAYNPRQHAQIYDARPDAPLRILDRSGAPKRLVAITAGPRGDATSTLPGERIGCTVSAADSFGGPVSYAWTATAGAFDDPASRTPVWIAPDGQFEDARVVTIGVTAVSTENPAAAASASFTVTLLPRGRGDVRITAGPSATPATVAPGETVACSVSADAAAGGLRYQWKARDGAGANVGGFDDPDAAEPTWTAPDVPGTCTLSVRVRSVADPEHLAAGAAEVRVAPLLTHAFGAGVRMVGVPGAVPGVPLGDAVAAAQSAGWDAGAQDYVDASPLADAGVGCWARFASPTEALVHCDRWPGDRFTWQLERGWNIVTLPWDSPVPLSSLTSVPAQAVPRVAWTYQGGRYEVVCGLGSAGSGEGMLHPWRSYWVYARERCSATIARGTSTTAAWKSEGWTVRVVARAASGTDAAALCGVGEGLLTVPDAPRVADGPNIAFEGASGLLGVDLRVEQSAQHRWPLVVSAQPGEEVTVLCPDLSPIPAGARVVLEDQQTGAATSLRTAAGYRFTATERPRRLILRVEQAQGGSLALSAVTTQQTSPDAASVCFALSARARVSAEVLNIAGRPVRRLVAERPHDAAMHRLAWNLRCNQGRAVPAGRYLIRLTARAADGEAARALAPLTVTR